ncbi:TPA: methionyl-tRNA formyltransferase [Vibrio alginolyticus]|nr:methionyl-tRNA formyltransferase [Vibrio alginolyticus]
MCKKIVLHAMTKKGYEVATLLFEKYREIVDFLVIGKDKNIKDDYSENLRRLAINNGVQYYYHNDTYTIPQESYVLAVSWRWMIRSIEDSKLIVFHDSILPRYRGFAPLVNSLINGEHEIGVTALFGSDEYDKGDIIAQAASFIDYPMKLSDAIEVNNLNYIKLADLIFNSLHSGREIKSSQQDESLATYSIWRDESDYEIDWNQSSTYIKRFIDSVGYPYSGAITNVDENKVVVLDAEVVQDVVCEHRHVGKVIFVENGCPVVICGKGLLKITKAVVKEENQARDFLPINKFRMKFY